MRIEDQLFQTAADFVKARYPAGWGGAAAVQLKGGEILTSVAPDTDLDALALCMEVGAFLEAHKRDVAVTHSLCIYRADEHAEFRILSPCGICQERLRHWGPDVLVAISNPMDDLIFKPLRQLQPHNWRQGYGNG